MEPIATRAAALLGRDRIGGQAVRFVAVGLINTVVDLAEEHLSFRKGCPEGLLGPPVPGDVANDSPHAFRLA